MSMNTPEVYKETLGDVYTQIGEAGKAGQTRIEYEFDKEMLVGTKNYVIHQLRFEDGYKVERIGSGIKIDWS